MVAGFESFQKQNNPPDVFLCGHLGDCCSLGDAMLSFDSLKLRTYKLSLRVDSYELLDGKLPVRSLRDSLITVTFALHW